MRQALLTLALLGLAANCCPSRADDVPGKKQNTVATNRPGPRQAYLGLEIEPISPALFSQLSGVVPMGQGVLVVGMPQDCLAAKSGLRRHDILLSYDDHRLHAPEQLIKLVRSDTPGRKVTMRLVRCGKQETCTVTLGDFGSAVQRERSRVFRFRPDERLRQMFEESQSRSDNPAWESIDALKLTRLDNKRCARRNRVPLRNGEEGTQNF